MIMFKDNLIIIDSFLLSASNKYNTNTDCSCSFLHLNNISNNGDKKFK